MRIGRGDVDFVRPMVETIEEVVGYAPTGCPWRALDDAFVREVLTLFGARENGVAEALVGSWETAPRILVEGLAEFDRAFQRARGHIRRIDDEKREQEAKSRSAKPGRGV